MTTSPESREFGVQRLQAARYLFWATIFAWIGFGISGFMGIQSRCRPLASKREFSPSGAPVGCFCYPRAHWLPPEGSSRTAPDGIVKRDSANSGLSEPEARCR